MSRGEDSHPNAVKWMFTRTKPLYNLKYEQNAVRVRNILSCVLSSGILQWVRTREALPIVEWIGSLYAWFRLHIN